MKIDIPVHIAAALTTHRQNLHRIPELGFDTYKTQSYIYEQLAAFHPDSIERIEAGIKAVFKAQNPIATLAFRADMDALPVEEQTTHGFASTHDGLMHACGHDGHMSTVLAFAQYVSERRAELIHDVVLLFQPGEEGYCGARILVDHGALKGVDAIFGLHLMPSMPEGELAVQGGPLMAATAEFDIKIEGRTAHGALPHEGVDALLAAAHFLTQAQTVVSRSIDPLDPCVVSFGKLTSGTARNVVAASATLCGTARSFSKAIKERTFERIHAMLRGIEQSFEVKTELIEHVYFPAVVNDEGLANRVRTLLPEHTTVKPLMIAEDFACYQLITRGLFMFLGCRDDARGYNCPLHTGGFDFDERVLIKGLETYIRIAWTEDILDAEL